MTTDLQSSEENSYDWGTSREKTSRGGGIQTRPSMGRDGRDRKENRKCGCVLGMADNSIGRTERPRVRTRLSRGFGAYCRGLSGPKLKAGTLFCRKKEAAQALE